MPLQIQFLDSRSGGHRYFSLRIQERRIQYVCRGQTVVVRVMQGQHGDLRQRLVWDLLSIKVALRWTSSDLPKFEHHLFKIQSSEVQPVIKTTLLLYIFHKKL
jgi:hypothetical protein